MTNKKNYCADLQGGLWLQYQTDTGTWAARPCCLFGEWFTVTSNIDVEFWKNPKMIAWRQQNLEGAELPDQCQICKTTEKNGNLSRRQSWNERLGTDIAMPDSVIEADIQVDFTCNLACRICSPAFSTKWRKVLPITESKTYKVRAKLDNEDIINTVPMHDIKQIHFQGGEPFLTDSHINVLKKIEKNIDLSQVHLWYHSNGTIRVSDSVLKFWEKFKLVTIYFSIDDMGPRMEYQRWPMIWNEVAENLIWYQNNIPHNALIEIERTVGVLNAYWLDEFELWHRENLTKTKYGDPISINYHTCFERYSLSALTQSYKDDILEKFDKTHWVFNTVKDLAVDNESEIQKMLHSLNLHDSIRKQDWREIFPEFLKWYNNSL